MSVEAQTDEALAQGLAQLLDVEEIDVDLYRGSRTDEPWTRVYGGQVVGQALAAATRTVRGSRAAHSLHAYFLRPGDPSQPIIYRVERDMDGRAFSNRRVVALQKGKVLLNLAASFHVEEAGLSHAVAMPDVAGPDGLRSDRDLKFANIDRIPAHLLDLEKRVRPVEFRPVEEQDPAWPGAGAMRQHHWFRVVAPLPDDDALHRAVLAYASDWVLMGAATRAHGKTLYDAFFDGVSLDHGLWIHGPVRTDAWLLYAQEAPWSGGARAVSRGHIFTQDGRLVASVSQEGLIRPRTKESRS